MSIAKANTSQEAINEKTYKRPCPKAFSLHHDRALQLIDVDTLHGNIGVRAHQRSRSSLCRKNTESSNAIHGEHKAVHSMQNHNDRWDIKGGVTRRMIRLDEKEEDNWILLWSPHDLEYSIRKVSKATRDGSDTYPYHRSKLIDVDRRLIDQ